jgi:hypothetical protein
VWERFPASTVAALLEIAWWDWPIEKITRNLEKIVAADRPKGLEERLLSAVARSRTRKPLEVRAPGAGSWPRWARRGVEAARLAPSAVNRQPWRFSKEDRGVILAQDSEQDTYRIPNGSTVGLPCFTSNSGRPAPGCSASGASNPRPRLPGSLQGGDSLGPPRRGYGSPTALYLRAPRERPGDSLGI